MGNDCVKRRHIRGNRVGVEAFLRAEMSLLGRYKGGRGGHRGGRRRGGRGGRPSRSHRRSHRRSDRRG